MTAMPTYAMTYVVYWPHEGVLKVGRAWRFHRVQMMVRSGAQVLVLARGTDATWEAEALRVLRRWFPAAFANGDEAADLLFMGRGWSECFQVDEQHLQLAVDLCFEGFARGNDQGINEAADDQRDRLGVPGVSEGTARGEADGARPVDEEHGRVGAPGVRPGADRGGAVPGEGLDRDGRGAPADAGRVGIPDAVPSGRGGLDSAAATAEGGHPRSGRRVPTAARPGTSTEIHGCGGSAGEGGSAGAGRGRRADERVGRVGGRAGASTPAAGKTAPAGRSAHRLPRSSARRIRELRTLRDGPPEAREMGSAAALHRTAHQVRSGNGGRGR